LNKLFLKKLILFNKTIFITMFKNLSVPFTYKRQTTTYKGHRTNSYRKFIPAIGVICAIFLFFFSIYIFCKLQGIEHIKDQPTYSTPPAQQTSLVLKDRPLRTVGHSMEQIFGAGPLLKFDYNFPIDYYPNSSAADPRPCKPRESDQELAAKFSEAGQSQFMVDWREVPYDEEIREKVKSMELDEFVYETVARNPSSKELDIVMVTCTYKNKDDRKYLSREQNNWSYALIWGYRAVICFSKEMEKKLTSLGDSFKDKGHSWKTICMIGAMRKFKEAELVLWLDDDAFIRPSHFDLPLSKYLRNFPKDYIFAWDKRWDFNSGAVFVRINEAGYEIMLDWISENHLYLWLHLGRQMSDQMALTSIMIDALDKAAGNKVTHRQRAMLGTVAGQPWGHFLSWKKYVSLLLTDVFGATNEGNSAMRSNKTKPWWFISNDPPFHPTYESRIRDAFVVHPSGRSGTLISEHKSWEFEDPVCSDEALVECKIFHHFEYRT